MTSIKIKIDDEHEITGFFNMPEVRLYRQLAKKFPEGRMVEVGTWLGLSIASVLNTLKKNNYKFIGCVDTWAGSENELFEQDGSPGPHHRAVDHDIYKEFQESMELLQYWHIITPMRMDSLKAAEVIDNESLDLVFLDGDHRYHRVISDIDAWLPKVKKGGIIFGHDINWVEDVRKAVDFKFDEDWELDSNCWVHYKK